MLIVDMSMFVMDKELTPRKHEMYFPLQGVFHPSHTIHMN